MIIPVIEAAMTGLTKLPDQRDTVYVIDPDEAICDGLTTFLGTLDIPVRSYSNAEAFLDAHAARSPSQGCLLVDANLQGMGTLALLRQLRAQRVDLPVVVLASTSNGDIDGQVFEAGAVDVIEKPQLDSVLVDRSRQTQCKE
jgi:FixJ family two-component response regulator